MIKNSSTMTKNQKVKDKETTKKRQDYEKKMNKVKYNSL